MVSRLHKMLRPGHERTGYRVIKRLMDIVFSGVGLVLAIPLIAVVGCVIRLESKGALIYSQERLGKDGQIFTIYKLRSMYFEPTPGAEQWTEYNDPRITRVGRFIRKMRIDELPQLWNILKGEMSLVGPRPERAFFAAQFAEQIPQYRERLRVKPGLTGWAQVNGGYEIAIEEKLRLDLYYIEHQSLGLDVWILLRTLVIVFTSRGAR